MNQIRKCKTCKALIAKSANFCPYCGTKRKKSIFKKWWFWVLILILIVASCSAGANSDSTNAGDTDTKYVGNTSSESTVSNIEDNTTDAEIVTETEESSDSSTQEPVKTNYRVGDIVEDGDLRIVYMSSGDYIEDNKLMQPADGNKYIFLQFAFENISDTNDTSISYIDFEGFADEYAVDMYYGGEEDLSATLSAGRATTGYIYFEVPVDAQVIEVEYETNFFTEEKIKFIFEGDKDSGYVQKLNSAVSEDAYSVGDIVESSNLKITYIACEEYISDNMFVEPISGYRYMSCEFEFENVGSSDEYISSFDFDCYADGLNCDAIYIRDDDLGATLSAGRKTKGTITFEVPIDAKVIEVEYLSNYWTDNRVVFTVE